MTALYLASAIAVVSVASPDTPIGKRGTLVQRVFDAGDDGVQSGGWEYTAGNGLFATFSVARPE